MHPWDNGCRFCPNSCLNEQILINGRTVILTTDFPGYEARFSGRQALQQCTGPGMTVSKNTCGNCSELSEAARMNTSIINHHELAELFRRLSTMWRTCDWKTAWGDRQLNLDGLHSRQAECIARATCGQESLEWRRAAEWLRVVEQDATSACEFARKSLYAIEQQDFATALAMIEQACLTEARWHTRLIWEPLRTRIRERRDCASHADVQRPK